LKLNAALTLVKKVHIKKGGGWGWL